MRRITTRAPFRGEFLLLFTALLVLSNTAGASPDGASTDYRLSAETWAENYFEFFSRHHLKVESQLMVPQVWLFSPEGHMVRIASKDMDPQLQELAAAFPDSLASAPLADQPSSTQARDFLTQALADQSVPAPREGHWYAVLVLKERPIPNGGCNACAAYVEGLRAIQKQNPGILDTVSVTLTLSR